MARQMQVWCWAVRGIPTAPIAHSANDRDTSQESISASDYLVTPIWWVWIPFYCTVDEFVPHAQHVNLRIVAEPKVKKHYQVGIDTVRKTSS
jgi:hypothetical protein